MKKTILLTAILVLTLSVLTVNAQRIAPPVTPEDTFLEFPAPTGIIKA